MISIIVTHRDVDGTIKGTSEIEIPNVIKPYIEKFKAWLDAMFPDQKKPGIRI